MYDTKYALEIMRQELENKYISSEIKYAFKASIEALEKQSNDEKVSELHKAIFTLLYDQYDCPDVTPSDYDDTFVDHIINVLAGENGSICPFKNYSMEKLCEYSTINCHGKYLDIDCGSKNEDVWRMFINKTYREDN